MSTLIVCAVCNLPARWLHWVKIYGLILPICSWCRWKLREAVNTEFYLEEPDGELAGCEMRLLFEVWRSGREHGLTAQGERLANRVYLKSCTEGV